MARASVRELRIKARKLGIRNARELSPDELEEAIADAGTNGHSKTKSRTAVKKAVTKKRGPGRPRKVVEDDDEEDEPVVRRRGRPAGSKNKTTAVKKTTARRGPGRPPKSETSTARRGRSAAKKTGSVGRPPGSGTGSRILVPDTIKWNKNFDFRDGSTSQYILNELRKAAQKYSDTADIRETVIEKLEPKIGKVDELTFNNRATGRPHKGEQAEKMLRYRVNRTILDYCIETDQHDGSTASRPNKASNTKTTRTATKTKRGPGRPRKVVDEDDYDEDDDEDDEPAPRRRGRPPGSGNKKTTTTTRRGPGRPRKTTTAEAPKRRGRPPGSKNKTTTTAKRGPGRPKDSTNRR